MNIQKRKDIYILFIAIVMVVCIIFSIYYSYSTIYKFSKISSENSNEILTDSVFESINSALLKPVIVSQTMANDSALFSLMGKIDELDPYYYETIMITYLNSVCTGFGYDTVFAVIDANKAYYSSKGFYRYISPENDYRDVWYSEFISSGRNSELNLDYNDSLGDDLIIFSNNRVEDSDGTLIGVCGVGIKSDVLLEIIDEYEKTYDIKIYLTNSDGLVQVSSDSSELETKAFPTSELSIESKHFSKYEDTYLLSKYITDLDWYLVISSDSDNQLSIRKLIAPIIIILVIGLLSMILVIIAFYQKSGMLDETTEVNKQQYGILLSMSHIYLTMHLINLDNDTVTEFTSAPAVKKFVNRETEASKQMAEVMKNTTMPEWRNSILHFTDLSTIRERINTSKSISIEYQSKDYGWVRARFTVNSINSEGLAKTVIFTTQIIEEEKNREEQLIRSSSTDELTRLKNRRAYVEDISRWNISIPDNLVIVSMDLNGLKAANDQLGHAAGDELLVAASSCMKKAFSEYGSTYRTGGDEFIAIFRASKKETKDALESFQTMLNRWKGKYISTPSVSCGVVFASEFEHMKLEELIREADKRMYVDKSEYYKRTGRDRRSSDR